MVGQLVIGVLRSSMNATNLSNQLLRSIESSISYSFAKLSGFCKRRLYIFFLSRSVKLDPSRIERLTIWIEDNYIVYIDWQYSVQDDNFRKALEVTETGKKNVAFFFKKITAFLIT